MAGCQSAAKVPADGKGAAAPTPVAPEPAAAAYRFQRVVTPEGLRDKVGVRNFRAETTGKDALISATLQNLLGGQTMVFEVCTQFVAADGRVLDATPWRRLTLPPGARHQMIVTAEYLPAADIQIVLRLPTESP